MVCFQGPPSSAWDHEMSEIVHSLTKTEMKWCKKIFGTCFWPLSVKQVDVRIAKTLNGLLLLWLVTSGMVYRYGVLRLWAGEEEYDTRLPFTFQNTGRMAVRLDVVE